MSRSEWIQSFFIFIFYKLYKSDLMWIGLGLDIFLFCLIYDDVKRLGLVLAFGLLLLKEQPVEDAFLGLLGLLIVWSENMCKLYVLTPLQ